MHESCHHVDNVINENNTLQCGLYGCIQIYNIAFVEFTITLCNIYANTFTPKITAVL